jgi:hypothetical protein
MGAKQPGGGKWPKADWRLSKKGPWKAAVRRLWFRLIYSIPPRPARRDPASMCQKPPLANHAQLMFSNPSPP